jgi:hypothetical protein
MIRRLFLAKGYKGAKRRTRGQKTNMHSGSHENEPHDSKCGETHRTDAIECALHRSSGMQLQLKDDAALAV